MYRMPVLKKKLRPEYVRAELRRIEIMQKKWNALTLRERTLIARASPDLSLFFQPRRMITLGRSAVLNREDHF
jgi:hypothetical protein